MSKDLFSQGGVKRFDYTCLCLAHWHYAQVRSVLLEDANVFLGFEALSCHHRYRQFEQRPVP